MAEMMKRFTIEKKWLGLLVGIWVLAAACKKDRTLELDEFYRFQMVKELKLDTLDKKVYIMGFEETNSVLTARAFDAVKKQLNIPDEALKYYANGEELENGVFEPSEEGDYLIYAKLGSIVSDTISVRIWNKMNMKLVLKSEVPPEMVADGFSQVVFKPEIYLNGALTSEGPNPEIYIDGQKIASNIFSTKKAGLFEVQAKGFGLESEKVLLEVLSPAKKLVVNYSLNSSVFWANNVSEATISIQGLDASNQVVDLTEDVQLFHNGELVTYPLKFKTNVVGLHNFVAKGYKIQSNEVSITAQDQGIYSIIRMPVVFHEVNTKELTATAIKDYLANLTLAYRNNLNRSGGPKDGNSADVFIEFYAATTDPNGNTMSVPGLDRITSTKSSFTINDTDAEAWNSFWNPETYINVWIFPNIKGDYASSSWAYFPAVTQFIKGLNMAEKGSRPYYPFGVFWNYNHKIYIEVLAHEVGHVLGLSHVFDGNGSSFESCSSDDPDYCPDTPYYDRNAYEKSLQNGSNKNYYRRTACSGEVYNSTNYMDYDYSYENSFTANQVSRMRFVTNYGLWIPTPFNQPSGGRRSAAAGMIKKPDGYIFTPPVICPIPK